MKPSAKMTNIMMLKAFGESGRNNFEIALVTLSPEWLSASLETTNLFDALTMDFGSYSLARKDDSAKFLAYDEPIAPFYEGWFGNEDFVFLETEPDELQKLFRIKEPLKSDALMVHCNGLAFYQVHNEVLITTAKFDLFLIQEILNNQN